MSEVVMLLTEQGPLYISMLQADTGGQNLIFCFLGGHAREIKLISSREQ